MPWPIPGSLAVLPLAALLLTRLIRPAFAATCLIAIAITLFACSRPLTVRWMIRRLILALPAVARIALLLPAGSLSLRALLLVALIVCHGHLLCGDMATREAYASLGAGTNELQKCILG